MDEETPDKMTLEWIRNVSLRSLMQLRHEQLRILQVQADKELFSAQLTKDWIDGAIRFRLWNEVEADYD